MNGPILRRSLLLVGMAAIVSVSVYAAAGTSSAASGPQSPKATATGVRSAASGPQSPRAGAVRKVPVKFGVMNKAGKTAWRGTGEAKIVLLGSAAQAGAAGPDAVEGPSPYCDAHFAISSSIGSADSWVETITFPSTPFVVGPFFNEAVTAIYTEVSEQQKGDVVTVTILNNGPSTETYSGSVAVLYADGGC
jgi:hypothetical protein